LAANGPVALKVGLTAPNLVRIATWRHHPSLILHDIIRHKIGGNIANEF